MKASEGLVAGDAWKFLGSGKKEKGKWKRGEAEKRA